MSEIQRDGLVELLVGQEVLQMVVNSWSAQSGTGLKLGVGVVML